MNWKALTDKDTLEEIKSKSFNTPIVIFKHSTRCNISSMVLSRFERSWNDAEMQNTDFYFLDLITYRSVSNKIESDFDVHHQSPQLLIISEGICVYNTSHMGISYKDLKNNLVGLPVTAAN